MSQNIFMLLKERGFIDQQSHEDMEKHFDKPISFYVGFDPTSDSLHLGNLVGIIALSWLERFGHRPYALVGGATGRIGDPSGKSIERSFLDDFVLENNISLITDQLKTIINRRKKNIDLTVINNNDWFKTIHVIDFLRDIGKHFRLGTMLGKESVRLRLNSKEGMSFTEFSYQILQGYDFHYLFSQHKISLQIGGSDQWGNIVSGIELIRRISNKAAIGMTFPLLTNSEGKKFGKTESGAVWLSEKKMMPYEFYQYLYKVSDKDVIKLLKMLTFLENHQIKEIENNMEKSDYIPNEAQKILAKEVTSYVHGEEAMKIALDITKKARPGAQASLNKEDLFIMAKNMPHLDMHCEEIINQKYTHIMTSAGLVSSKSEATRLIKNNGAYLNNKKIDDVNYTIEKDDIIEEKYLLLGIGKKKKLLIILIEK